MRAPSVRGGRGRAVFQSPPALQRAVPADRAFSKRTAPLRYSPDSARRRRRGSIAIAFMHGINARRLREQPHGAIKQLLRLPRLEPKAMSACGHGGRPKSELYHAANKSGGDIQCPDEKSCMSIHRFATPRMLATRDVSDGWKNRSIDSCLQMQHCF